MVIEKDMLGRVHLVAGNQVMHRVHLSIWISPTCLGVHLTGLLLLLGRILYDPGVVICSP